MAEPEKRLSDLSVSELRAIIAQEIGRASRFEDRLVDADEAALILNVSTDWLYHNHKKLPFVKKLGRKLLKFSVAGINRWIATRSV